jgi:hypothetical protein
MFSSDELAYRHSELIQSRINFILQGNKNVVVNDIVRLPIINGLYCGLEVVKREKNINSPDNIAVTPKFFNKGQLKDYIIVCYRPYELGMISTIEKV